jgi:type I restriction-modification system DNA methylase subunit
MSDKKESGKMYTCKLCKKTFKQKCDYDKHANAKRPCITIAEMQQMTQMKEVSSDNKTKLTSIFKNCLNILRDNEGLIGEKGLRTLSHLLILKLIEKHFGREINIDEYDYDFSHIQDELIDRHKKKLLEIVRFTKLSEEKEDNIPVMMKHLWDDILSAHPTTKNIFLKGKGFDIQHKSTFKKLIDKLNSIDLSDTEYDVLGNAYEEVIQDIMTGKVLGQFFTQPLVKKMMVRLINPQINDDGTIESCCDPTMGTGGFLIEYIRVIQEKARLRNITIDWDFIKTDGLYGKELEPDTYQLAVSNMLISTGHMFEKLDRGDSIREPIERKFDNILANPPFGIKGLKYDDFQSSLKLEYVPIKSDNAVSLFIQAIIYMLNIGGKCAVVLPDGQDLFSKTNTTLVAVREYLMKTCDLKEIYYLPSGIFTNTTIKTCVFYFVKKREGTDVLEVNINVSKTQKETGRDYRFSKTHQTTKVAFYDYNPYEGEGVKNLLVEVPIEKIVSNSYSLNYAEYMKDETEEEQYEESVVIKTLGEVCKIQNGKRIVKEQVETGEYPVLGGGGFTSFYTNEYSREGKTCKISREGMSLHNCVMLLNEKYYLNSQAFTIKSNNESIINEYLWYYLDNNKEQVFKCGRGPAQKAIDIDEFKSISIPIPSLERQQEIVKYLDFIYEKANKTSREKIAELKQLNEFCLNNQKRFGDNVVKIVGEVCEINQGDSLTKTEMINGIFNVIGGGKIIGKHNQKNRDGDDFTLTRVGDININYIDKPYYLTDNGFSLKSKKSDVSTKYIYYLFCNNKNYLTSLYQGTAQKVISKTNLKLIKIQIPILERQKEIVAYCESNDELIKQLEMEIENNNKQAQQFLKNAIRFQAQEEEDE